jgi:hypothetical protein
MEVAAVHRVPSPHAAPMGKTAALTVNIVSNQTGSAVVLSVLAMQARIAAKAWVVTQMVQSAVLMAITAPPEASVCFTKEL